jgi:drug/metabolite transporter (DMT)-like permease
MSWLLVIISAYLILAIVSLVDKYLLVGPISNPKVYTFYIGTLGILVLILAPFVGFYIPELSQITLSLLAGASFIYGIFWLNRALYLFETSRVIPVIGGILPIFSFLLIYIFSRGKEIFTVWELLAFILLIFGGVLIVYPSAEKNGEEQIFFDYEKAKIFLKSLRISATAAFFLALSFVLAKYVYIAQPFWSGYIWIRIGGFLMAMSFLFAQEVRDELFKVKMNFPKKTAVIFLLNQAAGASANILQNWAIALAPLICVAIINALQGVQYMFLLMFATLLSLKFPGILKEEISKEILSQKIIAILLIGGGLALLAF